MSLGLAAVLAVVGASALSSGLGFWHKDPPHPPALTAAEADAVEDAALRAQAALPYDLNLAPLPAQALGRSTPVHLRISRVGIDTSLMELGLAPDGTLQVPPDSRDAPAGWYRGMASPGEVGPAVIVGHLDAPDSPAVFYNLGALRAGDRVTITRADGSVVVFRVREVGSYPRDYFPTAAVYGPSPNPVLRLVTCGGSYAHGSGYTHNVIVFADLVGTATAEEPGDRPAPAAEPVATPAPESPADPAQTVTGPSAYEAELSPVRQRAVPPRRPQIEQTVRKPAPPVRRVATPTKSAKPRVVYREEPYRYNPWDWE